LVIGKASAARGAGSSRQGGGTEGGKERCPRPERQQREKRKEIGRIQKPRDTVPIRPEEVASAIVIQNAKNVKKMKDRSPYPQKNLEKKNTREEKER